jgi:hypothetical protein
VYICQTDTLAGSFVQVATGGTLSSGIELVKNMGGTVVECACVVELKMFIDPPVDSGYVDL